MHFNYSLYIVVIALLLSATLTGSSLAPSGSQKVSKLSVPRPKAKTGRHSPSVTSSGSDSSEDSESSHHSASSSHQPASSSEADALTSNSRWRSHSPVFPIEMEPQSSSSASTDPLPALSANRHVKKTKRLGKAALRRKRFKARGRTKPAPGDFEVIGKRVYGHARRIIFIPMRGSRRDGGRWNTMMNIQIDHDGMDDDVGDDAEDTEIVVADEDTEIVVQTLPETLVSQVQIL